MSLEVRFVADAKVDDGRHANNGWLQECPEPITKLTWDNAIIISPGLAKALGVVAEDSALQIIRKNPNLFVNGIEVAPWARLTVGSHAVEGPLHIQPGLDTYTVQLPLGYGRTRAGRIAADIGFDFYSVRPSTSLTVSGATIEIVPGKTY